MLKNNKTITNEDIQQELTRITTWLEDCMYASKIDNVYATWKEQNDFKSLILIFETTDMTSEKYNNLREIVDFELQQEIPLEVIFGNHVLFKDAQRIF